MKRMVGSAVITQFPDSINLEHRISKIALDCINFVLHEYKLLIDKPGPLMLRHMQ
jgi:hypothetical protein